MQLPLPLETRTENPGPRTEHLERGTENAEHRTPNAEPFLTFVRHPRARRYVIRVGNDGSVRVTVPRWGSKREAARFAARERGWIEQQRRRIEHELARSAVSPAHSGAGPDELARATRELPARLLELAAAEGLAVTRVSIRNQKWRWGSCSRSGHICLNWRLVLMPPAIRDYVMIHELMHLKRLDHSPRFWRLVAAACPVYQDARRWLQIHGRSLGL